MPAIVVFRQEELSKNYLRKLLQTAEVYIGKYESNEVNKYYFLIG